MTDKEGKDNTSFYQLFLNYISVINLLGFSDVWKLQKLFCCCEDHGKLGYPAPVSTAYTKYTTSTVKY